MGRGPPDRRCEEHQQAEACRACGAPGTVRRCGPDTAVAEIRGTWTGESQSIVIGTRGHHPGDKTGEPRFTSVAFTLVIDKQEGNRFSGTFSSAQHSETVVAVVSRAGTIYIADDDGHNSGTMLAPDRMEICYLHSSSESQIASCTELTKQKQ